MDGSSEINKKRLFPIKECLLECFISNSLFETDISEDPLSFRNEMSVLKRIIIERKHYKTHSFIGNNVLIPTR